MNCERYFLNGVFCSKATMCYKNYPESPKDFESNWYAFEYTFYKQNSMFQSSEVLSEIEGQMGL